MRKLSRLTPFDVDRSRARLVSEPPRGKRAKGMSAMVERFMRVSPFGLAKRPPSKTTPPPPLVETGAGMPGSGTGSGTASGRREGRRSREISTPLPTVSPLDSGTFLAAPRVLAEPETPEAPESIEQAVSSATVAVSVERAWVTLVVYGWHSVDPGPLSWVFPSFDAAISAVRAMRNAVKWAILAGERETSIVDVDEERRSGQVLLEK